VENAGTLSLRKTFGYHVYQRTGSLSLTQALLSQNSGADTLRYIGVDPPPAQDIPEDWNPDLNL
jgi:hypothetical protein